MSEMPASSGDWRVPCSDGEDAGSDWEPEPQDIIDMYNKLAKGETLPLEWTLPSGGRRSPSPERDDREESMEEIKQEEKMEEKQEPTEFDFDDISAEVMTPKRTPGSTKTSRSAQRRVATMDKIMGDIMRHKKINTPKLPPPQQQQQQQPPPVPPPSQPDTNEQTPTKIPASGNLSPKRL